MTYDGDGERPRAIAARTRGSRHGPITRLMSPSDLGQSLKPFVFLDRFGFEAAGIGGMDLHPHSGIATITILTRGDVRFDDPEAGSGTIGYGGVEWMRAAGGAWHGKEMSRGSSLDIEGFQLWIALGSDLENGPVENIFLEPGRAPAVGPAIVILGELEGVRSPIRSPQGITYLVVTLKAGERWSYRPHAGQSVAWLAVAQGALDAGERIETGEMVSFAPGETTVTLQADFEADAVFVLGAAVPHPHDLVLGHYSVHTSPAALRSGETRIAELGARLAGAGDPARPDGLVPVHR